MIEKCPADVSQYLPSVLDALIKKDWDAEWGAGLFGIGSLPEEFEEYSDDDYFSDDDAEWGVNDDAGGEDVYTPNESDLVRNGAYKV